MCCAVDDEVALDVVVVHGVAYEGERAAAKSDLDPALPHPVTGETAAQALARVGLGGAERASLNWSE